MKQVKSLYEQQHKNINLTSYRLGWSESRQALLNQMSDLVNSLECEKHAEVVNEFLLMMEATAFPPTDKEEFFMASVSRIFDEQPQYTDLPPNCS
jgi:hypothetical protein